jgi:hypothetical protein
VPQFLHLTDAKLLERIARNGIATHRWGRENLRCLFATPVLKNFQISHQWLRELKRNGARTIGAVQFRIPDAEEVLVGRYNEDPLKVTAAKAVKIFMDHSTGLGLQILILRRIDPKEITRTYIPQQVIGWRHFPEAHGKPPFCYCDYCLRGEIKSRKMRRKNEAKIARRLRPKATSE